MTTQDAPTTPLESHAMAANASLRRSRSLWRILAALALAVAVIVIAGRVLGPQAAATDRIARINIEGAIASDRTRLAIIEDLAEDELVRAVIVNINSPGGTTAGGEELYEALLALSARKPVAAVVNELGASAAYMTAIATDRIFARRLSIVGSIGVLYQHVNAGRLLEIIGIDFDKIASGPLKAEPDFDEPISPEARASIGALVTDSFDWFVEIVAERRGLDRGATLTLADGRILSGRQALEAGLIDEIGGEAEAIAWLEQQGVAADLELVSVYPLPRSPLEDFTRYFSEQARTSLGLPAASPVVLDGLVSLWQAGPAL